MKENFNLLCKIVSRISIRSWEEWVEGFSNLLNKILYDLKPGVLTLLLNIYWILIVSKNWIDLKLKIHIYL